MHLQESPGSNRLDLLSVRIVKRTCTRLFVSVAEADNLQLTQLGFYFRLYTDSLA